MSIKEKLLVYVLGAPGAGKSTQCESASKELGWSHISAGDLLRAQVAAGTEAGKVAEAIMKEGKMVPSSMIVGLLKDALSSHEHTKVLIDGFPRVLDQLEEFEQQVRPCDKAIFYHVSKETALERLNKRSISSGREDDNADTIHKRFTVFQDESMPVIETLRQQGKVVEIDAAAPADEVYAQTKAFILQLEQQQQQRHVPAPEPLEAAPAPAADGLPATTTVADAPQVPAAVEAAAAALSAENSAAHRDVALGQAAKPSTAGDSASEVPEGPSTSLAAMQPTAEDFLQSSAAHEPAAAATGPATESPAFADGEAAGASTAEQPSVAHSNTEQLPGQALQEHVPAVRSDAQPDAAIPAEEPAAAAGTAPVPAAADDVEAPQINMYSIRTPIVICGPSGVGKGTLINRLMEQYPDKFGFSVSHTTRAPRPGEQHGVHYNFTELDSMRQQVAAGLFLEHAEVHGNMYGTSLAAVANVSNQGKHCVLDIDVQGAQLVKASALGHLCLSIFIAPPSHEELEQRLRGRGTETEDKVLQRLENAEAEIAKAQEPGLFDHTLINADLDTAYQQLQQLINQKVPGLLPEPVAAPASKPAEVTGSVATTAAPAPADATTATVAPAAPAAAAAVMANGNATHLTPVPQPAGGTSTLLDFGFGASAGPAVATKGMPVRQYMDVTVIPVLREGLKALNVARPDDPLQFLADYLVAHKPAMH